MKVITLTQNQITVVNSEDYHYLSKFKCHAWYSKSSKKYYARVKINGKLDYIHKLILERKLGRPIKNKYVCDHRNGNTLDNRRKNLRETTYSVNVFNSKVRETNTLGVKGIRFRDNKFVARICHKGKQYHLGYYSTLEEAVKVRKIAEKIFYGENICNKF